MKKRIGIILMMEVLIAACCPQRAYGSVVYFDTANPNVQAGETISVAVFSTVTTDHIRLDRISDDAGGTASNLYLNPNYRAPLVEGVAVNENNILIEGIISSGLITPASPLVSGILYSFDYTVPLLPQGAIINIFADSSNGAVNYIYAGSGIYYTLDSLTLTVVPEPASILIFLLGAVAVRHKKK